MNKEAEKSLTKARQFENLGDLHTAIKEYKNFVTYDEENVEIHFKLAELYHQLGDLPAALSAYIRVADLDPAHQKAKVKIEMIQSIMNFYNPDMYNP